MTYILAIDQGTTSSRAILFSEAGTPAYMAQQEFTQHFPEDGWVEHDPEDIWSSTLAVCQAVMTDNGVSAAEIAGMGITNQRETTIVWDRATGEPVYPAIVWQDRRTADYCDSLKSSGVEPSVTQKTGLLLDPYFSATKVKWILDFVEGARPRAERGELLFGTVDTFLLWRLTRGESFKTDATNASRTLLFNIHTQDWDDDLLAMFDIPRAMLPEVLDCSADFGVSHADLLGGSLPILGVAGDQQAALIGQGCFESGMTKSTYGTGCFVIMNTGEQAIASEHKLLTTIAYRLAGKVTYGLEGSIFVAGAAVQWLRDGLQLVNHASETEAIAASHKGAHGVYLVPAFTGLGAPYWDPNARGALLGLTRDTGIADVVTATLQSVCFQTRDLLDAMASDGASPTLLRVDGGMVENNWVAQRLADILQLPVDRPKVIETTALGAAYLAGMKAGIYQDLPSVAGQWQLDRRFGSEMAAAEADVLHHGWLDAVSRVRTS